MTRMLQAACIAAGASAVCASGGLLGCIQEFPFQGTGPDFTDITTPAAEASVAASACNGPAVATVAAAAQAVMDSYMLLLEETITTCADDFRDGSACAVGGYHFNGTATVLADSFAAEFTEAAAACEQELCVMASDDGDAPAPAARDFSGRQPKEASISVALEAVLEELVIAAFDQECDVGDYYGSATGELDDEAFLDRVRLDGSGLQRIAAIIDAAIVVGGECDIPSPVLPRDGALGPAAAPAGEADGEGPGPDSGPPSPPPVPAGGSDAPAGAEGGDTGSDGSDTAEAGDVESSEEAVGSGEDGADTGGEEGTVSGEGGEASAEVSAGDGVAAGVEMQRQVEAADAGPAHSITLWIGGSVGMLVAWAVAA